MNTVATENGAAVYRAPARRDETLPAVLFWALLALIFALGLGLRLYQLAAPPLDFHPTRQLHGALIARGMYYSENPAVPAWQRDMAVAQQYSEGVIEPQVLERVSAWGYALVGEPDLRIPRLVTILCWMAAAGFITMLSIEFSGRAGALAAAVFFLAWPYGVVASRAFQPEPLLLVVMAAALWAALRWMRSRAWSWAVATGLLAGLALYIKVVAVFLLAPALLALILSALGLRGALRSRQVWVVALLSALPYAIYHIDGMYLRDYLIGQFSLRFFPEMWLDPAFYLRWLSNLGRAVPFELVLVSLLGIFTLRRPVHRALLLAMWGGYLLYGFALSHHISTHDYYHLLIFPLVALGLGAAAAAIFQAVREPRWLARVVIALALLAALGFETYQARTQLKRSDAGKQASALLEIGRVLGPGASVVALVDDYGAGLKYYAWMIPSIWPTEADIQFRERAGEVFDFDAFFAEQAQGKEYFVITNLDELSLQARLRELLETRYRLYSASDSYLIYDLREAQTSP